MANNRITEMVAIVLIFAISIIGIVRMTTYDGSSHIASPIAAAVAAESARSQSSGKQKLTNIGVQLYTVRDAMEKDFEGTLRRIADMGYKEVEFAGLFGRDPVAVKALLVELGLTAPASHVNWEKFKTNPDALIEETLALGAKYMILAWMPEEERQTLDQWRDWVSRFNSVGKRARAKGVRFAYHNHEFEFQPVDGIEPYDLILEGIDRRYVELELDLYWLALAGKKPETYFARYPGGFPFAHVKDMSGADGSMVDVGDGVIDFATIFAMAEQSGMQHFIVEHDNPEDAFRTLQKSIAHLRGLEF